MSRVGGVATNFRSKIDLFSVALAFLDTGGHKGGGGEVCILIYPTVLSDLVAGAAQGSSRTKSFHHPRASAKFLRAERLSGAKPPLSTFLLENQTRHVRCRW